MAPWRNPTPARTRLSSTYTRLYHGCGRLCTSGRDAPPRHVHPAQEATVHSSPQPVPTGAHGVRRAARRRDNCPAHQLARVHELPLRLEPVVVDDFGGLLASPPASRSESTNHPRGVHS